jgi:signal transduction histidine kinase
MLITVLISFSIAVIILLIWVSIRNHALKKLIHTQTKKVEDLTQLQKDNEIRIHELLFEKQQLLSLVSHDLKGPFNRVFALTQLLQNSSDNLQNEQKDYLGKMHGVIADGLAMIRNLMDYQKLEGKGIDLNPEKLNFSSVIGVLIRNYKVLAGKKNIELHLEMPPAMMLHADKYSVHRILDNLLSNALKFSSENKNVFIKAHDDGLWINVDVRDEGPGISEEDQAKLFTKFQTLSAIPTGGETATGLGLAVAKAFADKMKAELSCNSVLGQGSIFTLKIRKA